jgi:hypothetical protein
VRGPPLAISFDVGRLLANTFGVGRSTFERASSFVCRKEKSRDASTSLGMTNAQGRVGSSPSAGNLFRGMLGIGCLELGSLI